MKRFILLFLAQLLSLAIFAQTESDAILGVWESGSGKARVKIDKAAEKFTGRIVWLREPNNDEGKPKTDKNNPDEKLRSTPLLGYRMLRDFQYKGGGNMGRRYYL